MIAKANPAELLTRLHERDRLVAHFDVWIRKAGWEPLAHADQMLGALRGMTEIAWLGHARVAGVLPPGEIMRELVIAVYADRALKQLEAASVRESA